jgi:hypothetical protein
MNAFAQGHPGWTFDAVDPAGAMLDLAARTLGPSAARMRRHQGYIDDAPPGPFPRSLFTPGALQAQRDFVATAAPARSPSS